MQIIINHSAETFEKCLGANQERVIQKCDFVIEKMEKGIFNKHSQALADILSDAVLTDADKLLAFFVIMSYVREQQALQKIFKLFDIEK